MELGWTPVTQAEVVFIDTHGANSKLSWWQASPVMGHLGLQPTLFPLPKFPMW